MLVAQSALFHGSNSICCSGLCATFQCYCILHANCQLRLDKPISVVIIRRSSAYTVYSRSLGNWASTQRLSTPLDTHQGESGAFTDFLQGPHLLVNFELFIKRDRGEKKKIP